MTTTRKRPPKGPRPAKVYKTHSAPFIQEELQMAQEWDATSKPPLSPAQLRSEYDDALSFLLLLESRINRLEQMDSERTRQENGEPAKPTAQIYFLSARSRQAKEANAGRRAKRITDPSELPPRAFAPPYVGNTPADALLLLDLLRWTCDHWEASAFGRALAPADRAASARAFHQVVRSILSCIVVPASRDGVALS